MMRLEQTVRDLNSSLATARVERVKTVEAHQSRIAQLQEKFLNDLKKAGRYQLESRELEIQKALALENQKALAEQKSILERVWTYLISRISKIKQSS